MKVSMKHFNVCNFGGSPEAVMLLGVMTYRVMNLIVTISCFGTIVNSSQVTFIQASFVQDTFFGLLT